MAKAVSYYSKNDEIGIRWAFPDKITFEKVESYSGKTNSDSPSRSTVLSISERPANRSRFRLLALPNSRSEAHLPRLPNID